MQNQNFTTSEIVQSLQHYFPHFTSDLHETLATVGSLVELPAGTLVLEQGNEDKAVFLLLAGRLHVEHTDRYGDEQVLNTIDCGEFLGEMSAFLDSKRTASIRCVRQSILLQFTGQDFAKLLDQENQLLKHISATLIKRLAASNDQSSTRLNYRHISLIPMVDNGKFNRFSNSLFEAMSNYGSVLKIELEQLVADGLWSDDRNYSQNISALFAHVYKLQSTYDYTLLVGKRDRLQYIEAIIGQSDKVLVVADESSEDGSNIQRIAGLKTSDWTLLNLTEKVESFSLPNLPVTSDSPVPHLHVSGHQGVERVARYVTGNAIKLVLGGGGARGIAHLGVYKALLESGIPVDFVGGTSIGSIMAVTIATGWSYDKAIKKAKKHLVTDKPLKDYRLPMISLLSGKKMEASLYTSFAEETLQSLLLPCFAVAANLSKAKTEIIDQGPITNAIRASISLPGIFPPAVHKGCLMLDGGIVDNLPLEHINTLADGPTIGVDLSHIKERELGYNVVPSTRQLLMDKMRKKKQFKVPNIYQTIMGTLTLASNEKRVNNENKFTVLIKPAVAKFGFLNFEKFDELVDLGYEASIDLLRRWKDTLETSN